MYLKITTHTEDGDKVSIVCGDLDAGRAGVHTYMLKEYPDATFDEETLEGDPT